MATVGIRDLKNRLTHYVQRAKAGEEVIVTDRGKPVALLHGLSKDAKTSSLDGHLAKLATEGRLTLARAPVRPVRRVKIGGPPIADTLQEDRRRR